MAIGIRNAPPLPPLPGAPDDAESIAECAMEFGYRVVTFTDKEGTPVEAQSIFDECSSLLKLADLEQFIIYFSGHGYAPLAGHEIWLLSNWNSDANEAINASSTIQIARRFENPRISFIADACRTTFNDPQGATGLVILPKSKAPSSNSHVDEFYATAFGDVSQQYASPDALKSYGIFSKELLNALKGAAAEDRSGALVVTSESLARYLEEAVPKACGQIPDAFIQYPDTRAKWRKPNDIYVAITAPPKEPGPALDRIRLLFDPSTLRDFLDAAVLDADKASTQSPAVPAIPDDRAKWIESDAERYREAQGRLHYESLTGISVIGAKLTE